MAHWRTNYMKCFTLTHNGGNTIHRLRLSSSTLFFDTRVVAHPDDVPGLRQQGAGARDRGGGKDEGQNAL